MEFKSANVGPQKTASKQLSLSNNRGASRRVDGQSPELIQGDLSRATALLSHPQYAGPANDPLRVSLLQQAQRSYGNRFVGRLLRSNRKVGLAAEKDYYAKGIQREPTETASPAAQPPANAPELWFQGVHLTADPEAVRAELRSLIGRNGLQGAEMWWQVLTGARSTYAIPFSAHARAYGGLRVKTALDMQREQSEKDKEAAMKQLKPMVSAVYAEVHAEAVKFIDDFHKAAKQNALKVLDAQETQANAEAIRYGITSETTTRLRSISKREPSLQVSDSETTYSMQSDSNSAKGLQGAAKVLLDRREKIQKLADKQLKQVKWITDPMDPKAREMVPDEHFAETGKEVDREKAAYEQLRSYLVAEYPALAAFSEMGKSTSELQTIAHQGAGPLTASLIGKKITDILTKIEKTRRGIEKEDINVWQLTKVIDATAVELGADNDYEKRRLVADKREAEQPGFWQDLALLAVNIAAVALAAPTGGASLAVAAGINVAVAATHVEDYLMKEAMSGTAFDKAHALSQEEPSLFWLAVEIVGTGLDVGVAASTMAKTFKTLGTAVKTAQTATDAKQAAEALDALRAAAKTERGPEFAERLVQHVKDARGGKDVAMKAAGATKDEIKILQEAGRVADAEATSGIGKAFKTTTGEINLSKSGELWGCASPCIVLREKYASVFAKSDEASKGFYGDLQKLEAEAKKIAKARTAAEANKNAAELAKVEQAAEDLKVQAAALEEKIRLANPGLAFETTEKNWKRIQRVSDALKDDTKWGNVTANDRLRLGHVYDSMMESLVGEAIGRTGQKVLHYVEVDATLIAKLRQEGGRVFISEGKIGSLRFDMLEINFKNGTAELIDLASTSNARHIAKTRAYKQALESLLKMPVEAKELLYTGPNGELLEPLVEKIVK